MIFLVNLIGIIIIAAVIWWFWFSKPKLQIKKAENIVTIKVANGVYSPADIQLSVNQSIVLRFIREDATPCAAVVIFAALNISEQLPLHEAVDIPLIIKKPGEYEFTCQMGMYRGKLIVK